MRRVCTHPLELPKPRAVVFPGGDVGQRPGGDAGRNARGCEEERRQAPTNGERGRHHVGQTGNLVCVCLTIVLVISVFFKKVM